MIKRTHLIAAVLINFSAVLPLYAQSAPVERSFDRIVVEGNERFRDGDILATSGLKPGEPYSEADLVAATEALQLTGEFERVRIFSTGPVLTVEVEEAPTYTGGLSFGLGVNTDTGVFGVARLRFEDALGISARIDGDLLVSEEFRRAGLGLSVPNDWGPGTALGFRISYEASDYDNTLFDLEDTRAELFWQFAAGPGTGELRFFGGRAEISDVDPLASPILQGEAGSESYSGFGFTYGLNGSGGSGSSWFANFSGEATGLSGDTELGLLEVSAGTRLPIGASGFALRFEANAGRVWGRSGDTPRAIDRFALGGTELRGFERGTVTPREVCPGCGPGGADIVTNLGGDRYASFQTELILPLFRNQEQLDAFVFADAGSAWSLDTPTSPTGLLLDDRKTRSSSGIGVSYRLEGGSIDAYFALDTNGERFDEEQKFGLVSRLEF